MSNLTVKEALGGALRDMQALSAEQLRAELDAHSNGAIAVALRESSEFCKEHFKSEHE